MERIDARRALELLTDIVDKAGDDFVYEKQDMSDVRGAYECDTPAHGCRYVAGDTPSCLVGHVLYRAGASANQLRRLDECGVSASMLTDSYGIDIDVQASDMLGLAQRCQDSGGTWGEALSTARSYYIKSLQESE